MLFYSFLICFLASAKQSCKVHEHASPCWRTRGNPSYWIRVLLPSRTSEKTPRVEQASTHVYVSVVFVYLALHSISGGRDWGLALISIQMFSVGSGSFAMASGALWAFAQDGSKRLKKAQKGAKGLKKALEKAVRACPVPPVRPKRLFEPASVPPVRSKRLFESAVQDHSSKRLDSATLCSAPLCSALLAPCMYMHGSTLVYIYIYTVEVPHSPGHRQLQWDSTGFSMGCWESSCASPTDRRTYRSQ